ncbi:MAG: hypothetical protein A3I78_10365 [Gammaproteobacteria bacterium RIFCSPLOWO2_02_FULL_56_15]|nr:MAG: hypothetical protein A3I78_10365 [Gammaproteobacteria bacterium RIFCSPLOWO2_02_FULL_56_15]
MKRRAFLGNFGKLSAAAGAVTLAGTITANSTKPADGVATRSPEYAGLSTRLKKLELSQKRMLKVALFLLALTLGLDLSLLL